RGLGGGHGRALPADRPPSAGGALRAVPRERARRDRDPVMAQRLGGLVLSRPRGWGVAGPRRCALPFAFPPGRFDVHAFEGGGRKWGIGVERRGLSARRGSRTR